MAPQQPTNSVVIDGLDSMKPQGSKG